MAFRLSDYCGASIEGPGRTDADVAHGLIIWVDHMGGSHGWISHSHRPVVYNFSGSSLQHLPIALSNPSALDFYVLHCAACALTAHLLLLQVCPAINTRQ